MKPIVGISTDREEQAFRLRHEYVTAVTELGGLAIMIPSDSEARGDIGQIAGIIDGLLLSGGGDLMPEYYREEVVVPAECLKFAEKTRSDFEMALLFEVVRRNKPVFGICYGMQLINVAFGGTLFQDIRHQLRTSFDHTRESHGIRALPFFVSARPLDDAFFFVTSSHHQAVKTTGGGLDVMAVADDGVVEGIYKKGYPFLVGVQWHPERNLTEKFSLHLFRSFIEAAAASLKERRRTILKEHKDGTG